jgi:hypothetical protein
MIDRWLIVLYIVILALIGVILVAESLPPVEAGLPPREAPVPAQPSGDGNGGGGEPIGAHMVLHVPSAPDGVWTIVQWQDTSGGWHNVDGWQGTLDVGHRIMWWLAPDLFGKGPFRWLVYQNVERDTLLATSESFHLPAAQDEKLRIEAPLKGSQCATVAGDGVSLLPSP